MGSEARAVSEPESAYAWARLCASLVLMTLGGIGMYGVSVALPLVQAEFAVARSEASFPYAATMIGGELCTDDECLEAGLFREDEIPWTALAFRSTTEALRDYYDGLRSSSQPARGR